MDFIAFIQKQTGNKVKVLKTDNGSGFVNSELGPFLKKNGILHQTSAPYCPEANGRVEREMRTLKDTARAMLQRYEMPEYLWAEAIATSVYVHNRVLDKQSPEITAYERVFGKKPSLDHLRVFGCTAYAQVPKEKRKVWQPKAERLILIGYDSASQKYRLYDESSGKVIIARNVSFYEPDQCVPVRLVVDERHAEESDDESDDETDSDSGSENSEIKEEDGDSENSEAKTETVESAEGEVDSSAAHSGVEDVDQGEDDQEIAIVPTPTPSSSRRASDTLEIHVTTADGNYVAKIPSQGRSNIVIPSPQKANAQPEEEGYGLRDRSKIKKTNRYHPIDNPNPSAHFAAVEIEPNSYKEAMASAQASEWVKAMDEEMMSHRKNGTWTLVEKPPKAKVLDTRWVFKVKRLQNGTIERYKARLVIKGYKQRPGIDYTETFASVCRYESIRLLLALAAVKGLNIRQFDVKTAFLYGTLDETVLMAQPEGYQKLDSSKVCLLNKSLYGLKQAPRCWNTTFSGFLSKFKLKPTQSDPCVYVGSCRGETVYLIIYVDDGLILSRSEKAIREIIETIERKFELKSGEATTYVGIEIEKTTAGEIILTQTAYVEAILEKFAMSDCKPASVPMQPNQELAPATTCVDLPYRELIGSLIFLAKSTRPDIQYATSKMAQFVTKHDDSHWKAAKCILRYLQGTKTLGLVYKPGTCVNLTGYTDSDYAGDKIERKSTSGFAFFLNASLVSWSSQK